MVVTHRGSVQPTVLNQTLAVHTQTTREATPSTTTPETNIGVTLAGTHVTPTCPTLPPKVAPQGALLANNQFAALALDGGTNNPNDDNGSTNSPTDWELILDDVEVPPELAMDDPQSKAIIKMFKDHQRNANSQLLSLRKYYKRRLCEQLDKTLFAIDKECKVEQRKREAVVLLVWEGIATDIPDMFRANKELSANLESIKQMMDTNAATFVEANQKNQSMFDKITTNQPIFQGNPREILTSMAPNNGTLASIGTTVTSITQTTADSVEAAVMGVKTLMVKEIGNIPDTIARVEGNMAILRNLVTLVQTPQVDATTVPTGIGLTACSDDRGDPSGPPLGPALLSLQDRVDILDGVDGRPLAATCGQTSSPGLRPPQVHVHTMDATNGRTTPVGATHSNNVRAYELPQAPSAPRGQLKSPMEPTGHFGSGLSINISSWVPRPGMSYPTNESAVGHGGVASPAPAPATDIPDFELPTGHFVSGLGATKSSRAAWAESARQRNPLAARVSGAPQRMDSCTSPFWTHPLATPLTINSLCRMAIARMARSHGRHPGVNTKTVTDTTWPVATPGPTTPTKGFQAGAFPLLAMPIAGDRQ
jgi:hypothetical protein